MVKVEKLRKVFYPPRGKPVVAVENASFEVSRGEIFGLLGPNGAGKTTMLRMLGSIITPTAGFCEIDGFRTDRDSEQVRRRVGYLSGNTKLYGRLTAREVLRYFGRLYGMTDTAIDGRTIQLTKVLTMDEILERRCDTLSTGQTQKVSIARALFHDPPVLILDEPTLGLDIMTSRTILDFISTARDQGRSIIFSTHYMTEAELLCDRIGLIHRGNMLDVATKAELYQRTQTDNLKDAFLHYVDEASIATPLAADTLNTS